MRRVFLGALVTLATTGVLGVVAVPSADASKPVRPPSLAGVSFSGTPTFSNASCSADGSGSFDYAVSGTLSGPYAGSYSETGTVTAGQGFRDSYVQLNPNFFGFSWTLSWFWNGPATGQATFSIDSPAGRVSGTKTWSSLAGACSSRGFLLYRLLGIPGNYTIPVLLHQANSSDSGLNSYSATIESGRRTYCDSGTTELNAGVFEVVEWPSDLPEIEETFIPASYTSSFASGAGEVSRAHPKAGCG